MKKISGLLLAIALPLFAQEANPKTATTAEPAEKVSEDIYNDQIYKEITVEDFESAPWDEKTISIRITKDQKADLQTKDQYPAPIKTSKKYLGIKVYGRSGDVAVIKPPKELAIKQHCQSISVWVYGKNFSGELLITLLDANQQAKVLSFGKLNFLGWRKLTVKLDSRIAQEDKFLAQPRQLTIMNLQYRPASGGRLPEWNYFYIDDISAKVREKYIDKQDDNW
jgi:hypothetical protein